MTCLPDRPVDQHSGGPVRIDAAFGKLAGERRIGLERNGHPPSEPFGGERLHLPEQAHPAPLGERPGGGQVRAMRFDRLPQRFDPPMVDRRGREHRWIPVACGAEVQHLAHAPLNKYEFPRPTIWPFIAAVLTSLMFVGSVFTAWALPIGAVPTAVALIFWFWPTAPGHHIGEPTQRQASQVQEAS